MKLLAEVLDLYKLHSEPNQLTGYDEHKKKMANTGKWCELSATEGGMSAASGTSDLIEFLADENLGYANFEFMPFATEDLRVSVKEVINLAKQWKLATPKEINRALATFQNNLKQGQWKSFAFGGVETDLNIVVSEMEPDHANQLYASVQQDWDE